MPTSRPALILVLLALVAVPVAAVAWLGLGAVEDRAAVAVQDQRRERTDRLREMDGVLADALARRRRALFEQLDELAEEPPAIREQLRTWRRVGPLLVLDRSDGRVLFPPPDAPASRAERDLLERTMTVWDGGALTAAAAAVAGDSGATVGPAPASGWHAWYHHGGLNLLLWRADARRIVAVELSRIEVMSELVAVLPDSAGGGSARTALVDAGDKPIYVWGAYEPPTDAVAAAELSLSPPLAAWTLRHYTADGDVAGAFAAGLRADLWMGLLALALALSGLAAWIFRERTREMRLASQRVSFVNQVSHELKTPLTNIRLYAELLQEAWPEDAEGGGKLDVIVDESRRLGRLIDNVLTFARAGLQVRPAPGDIDDVVRGTLDAFEPALAARGVAVRRRCAAGGRALVDRDAVGQIVSNLLGNVEKYAAGGGEVEIETARRGASVSVRVADRGPGIPEGLREHVFEPFRRASDRVTDGVAGVGLGLDIARRLARLHGGDLRLVPSEVGACFELLIHAPTVTDEEEGRA